MIELMAIGFLFWSVVFLGSGSFLDHFANKSREVHEEFEEFLREKQEEETQQMTEAGDYWDGGDIDYDTGEISADARASVRHPKNRDRAYSGSVERFHDGGW